MFQYVPSIMDLYTYVYIYIHLYTYTCIYTVYIHTYMHIHIYIYIHYLSSTGLLHLTLPNDNFDPRLVAQERRARQSTGVAGSSGTNLVNVQGAGDLQAGLQTT